MDFEKQIVLRTRRLIRVRNVRCLRSIVLAGAVDCGLEIPLVGAPVVGIVVRDAKRPEQRLQLYEDLVLTPPKDIGQDLPSAVIKGMPQPARFSLLADKTPYFVHFGFIHALTYDLDVAWGQACDEGAIHR